MLYMDWICYRGLSRVSEVWIRPTGLLTQPLCIFPHCRPLSLSVQSNQKIHSKQDVAGTVLCILGVVWASKRWKLVMWSHCQNFVLSLNKMLIVTCQCFLMTTFPPSTSSFPLLSSSLTRAIWRVLTSSSPGLHCLICDKSFSVSTELSIIHSGCIPNNTLFPI